MLIETLNNIYLEEAVQLVLESYKEELDNISLPYIHNAHNIIYESLCEFIDNGLGVVAIENNILIGFLTGIPIDKLFGNVKGIYCPLHFHGTIKTKRREVYQRLYEKAAEIWVSKDIFTHVITHYTHNKEVVNTFYEIGFGLRCMDAIRVTNTMQADNSKFSFRQLKPDEAYLVLPFELKLLQHLNASPVFMPISKKPSADNLTKWLSQESNYIWAAFDGSNVVAYIKITRDGENFITEADNIMNICGAYTIEPLRGSGISTQLLNYVIDFLKQNEIPYCGVDFESLNISGSKFWLKHFEAYTSSVVRRIDERINMS